MNVRRTAILAASAATLSTVALLPATAHAKGDDDGRVQRSGSCVTGVWKLKAKPDDGRLEVEFEIDTNRTEWHARFDADKNGSLSLKEFEALWLEARRQEMIREFQHLDPNGDAALSLDEYKAPTSSIVANRDRNGDGMLSRDDRPRGEGHRWRGDRGRDNDQDDDGDRTNQQ